jgi:hypothetical protein
VSSARRADSALWRIVVSGVVYDPAPGSTSNAAPAYASLPRETIGLTTRATSISWVCMNTDTRRSPERLLCVSRSPFASDEVSRASVQQRETALFV